MNSVFCFFCPKKINMNSRDGYPSKNHPPKSKQFVQKACADSFCLSSTYFRGKGSDSRKSPSNLRFAICKATKRDSQTSGFSSGTLARIRRFTRICESIRADRAILRFVQTAPCVCVGARVLRKLCLYLGVFSRGWVSLRDHMRASP